MFGKLVLIGNLLNQGIAICENTGKIISHKIFGTRYSSCCNARIQKVDKGIAMEICEECGKVHFKKTVLTKR